jgi:hypothetical protein
MIVIVVRKIKHENEGGKRMIHAKYQGPDLAFCFLSFGVFSPSKVQARKLYAAFMKEGLDKESPLKEVGSRLEDFIEKVQK